jgi:hypothetical protein
MGLSGVAGNIAVAVFTVGLSVQAIPALQPPSPIDIESGDRTGRGTAIEPVPGDLELVTRGTNPLFLPDVFPCFQGTAASLGLVDRDCGSCVAVMLRFRLPFGSMASDFEYVQEAYTRLVQDGSVSNKEETNDGPLPGNVYLHGNRMLGFDCPGVDDRDGAMDLDRHDIEVESVFRTWVRDRRTGRVVSSPLYWKVWIGRPAGGPARGGAEEIGWQEFRRHSRIVRRAR